MSTGYDLKKPCKNCPFGNTENRIRFRRRERAEEISESAYRRGFPCHLSAERLEPTDYMDGGYVFGAETQHCVGAAMMFMEDGHDCWPGVMNNDDLVEEWANRIDWTAPHFESEESFLDANSEEPQ